MPNLIFGVFYNPAARWRALPSEKPWNLLQGVSLRFLSDKVCRRIGRAGFSDRVGQEEERQSPRKRDAGKT